MNTADLILTGTTFSLVTGGILMIALLVHGWSRSTESSLVTGSVSRRLSSDNLKGSNSLLPKLGRTILPKDESKLNHLSSRVRQAGLYRRNSTAFYLGIKFVLLIAPILVGIVLCIFQFLSFFEAIFFGSLVGLMGNLAPGIWLSRLTKGRQKNLRHAMPDALDVIVICMEGGLSLPASLARVTTELKHSHPMLAHEMGIVSKEIQMGASTGEALRQFADRFGVDEVRSLAAVVIQSERYGASIVKALRVHAETLRLKRYQFAEAMAQKAPVKIVFPTVLCLFPAMYTVLMGPAAVELMKILEALGSP